MYVNENQQTLTKTFKKALYESIPIHVPQYVIYVENLPWAYRIVGIYIHKTYSKFGAHINCNIHTSCLSQFSLISILLNIKKALKHCDCRRTITNAYSQCIETDWGSLRQLRNLIIFLPRGMRSLFIGYCVWSFSHYPITDDHVVYIRGGYLDCSLPSQNTWSVWNTSTKMLQASILNFFSSNLVEKGAQKCKSSDFTDGPSATKSLKCLGSNEGVQHEAGGDNQSKRQNEKVGHKMLFLYSLHGTIQRIELPQNMCTLKKWSVPPNAKPKGYMYP